VLRGAADRDEAVQRTRQKLLVGSGDGPAKLCDYLGQGPLESWVAVVAVRLAVSLGRAESAERRVRDMAVGEVGGGLDPEMASMKTELRRELEVAVEAALRRLEHRERLVLRLYFVSGMSMSAIGNAVGVSQPTISSWVARARDNVLADVRRHFGDRLRVPRGDLASIARFVSSQVDISISRVLDDG
jgi:RNA polymerase sigma-70 factor